MDLNIGTLRNAHKKSHSSKLMFLVFYTIFLKPMVSIKPTLTIIRFYAINSKSLHQFSCMNIYTTNRLKITVCTSKTFRISLLHNSRLIEHINFGNLVTEVRFGANSFHKVQVCVKTYILTLSLGWWCNFAPPAAFSILHIENIFREPQ